jgi:general secretion pathway protein E
VSGGVADGDIRLADPAAPAAALPFSFARRHGVVVTAMHANRARLACAGAVPSRILAELRRHLGVPLDPMPVTQEGFDELLKTLYEDHAAGAVRVMEDLHEELDLSTIAQQLEEPGDLLESSDEAPIIRLINVLFTQAVRDNASDIHVEPFENRLVVRFRVDGMLREVLQPPRALAPMLVSRIKVIAGLDIAERRVPQDGRTTVRIAGRPLDVRVSTIPSSHGERVVLRLLHQRCIPLDQLGMDKQPMQALDAIVRQPHGMFLVTGPTGSGKTTTLYSILERLNDRSRNIMTVEEPIEYFLDGVGQTQVNSKVDLGFARGLRAILRQDPDVVMIGEIRDRETAQIAVQASLTGHLVLATLHTNTAIGAMARLRDMGIEPFLLASSLVGVLAQRLVRVLCAQCKQPYAPDPNECRILGATHAGAPELYAATGCAACSAQGFQGRTGVFELIAVDDKLRRMIHDGAAEHRLEKHARASTPALEQDGLRLVRAGVTALPELLRVVR